MPGRAPSPQKRSSHSPSPRRLVNLGSRVRNPFVEILPAHHEPPSVYCIEVQGSAGSMTLSRASRRRFPSVIPPRLSLAFANRSPFSSARLRESTRCSIGCNTLDASVLFVDPPPGRPLLRPSACGSNFCFNENTAISRVKIYLISDFRRDTENRGDQDWR